MNSLTVLGLALEGLVHVFAPSGQLAPVPEYEGSTNEAGAEFVVEAFEHNRGSAVRSASQSTTEFDYFRGTLCEYGVIVVGVEDACAAEAPVTQCADGSAATEPLWIRQREPGGEWSAWRLSEWFDCADDDAALVAAIHAEWASLTPGPVPAVVQPSNGWVFAQVPTIGIASDEPHTHQATLLGYPVRIVATPAEFVWDWGDGTILRTTDAGAPYPDHTVSHTFARSATEAEVQLTTHWSGTYAVGAGSPVSFASTVSSTSAPVELTIHHPYSRLVRCNIDGCDTP